MLRGIAFDKTIKAYASNVNRSILFYFRNLYNEVHPFKYDKMICIFSSSDLRIAFDLLDRNQDGRVTAGELQFMLKNMGIIVRDEVIDDLIKEASHSGN